jgi:hypothetical protein
MADVIIIKLQLIMNIVTFSKTPVILETILSDLHPFYFMIAPIHPAVSFSLFFWHGTGSTEGYHNYPKKHR